MTMTDAALPLQPAAATRGGLLLWAAALLLLLQLFGLTAHAHDNADKAQDCVACAAQAQAHAAPPAPAPEPAQWRHGRALAIVAVVQLPPLPAHLDWLLPPPHAPPPFLPAP